MSPGRRRSEDWDEDDVRIRPQRGKSRPRSKERPRHQHALQALVVTVDRGRYGCHVPGSAEDGDDRRVTAMTARELGHRSVVVGDRVWLVGDVSGTTDALARIVRVQPRSSVLRRTPDDSDPVERVMIANADQLAIMAAIADPEPRPRLIDRCLVAAFDAGLRPLLVLTKADLGDPGGLRNAYAALDVDILVTRRGADLSEVRDRLHARLSVFVGASGVGKSTLVNALVPEAARMTGAVNTVTGRGRHTSSSAVALPLPDDPGWVIDTPGIRSFGLGHVEPSRVVAAFDDLAPGTAGCPRSCSHDEPECALDEWVADGHAEPDRLDSLRRLLRSRDGED